MSFRDRLKKRKNTLKKRHDKGTKKTGGGRWPTIFLKDKVPEGVEFWICKEGKHLADIIPFEAGKNMPLGENLTPITKEGDPDYVLDLFVHTNVGNMNKPFVCPYENFGIECPICEYIKSHQLDKEIWKKLVAKHRVVYFLWVHDNREEEKKGIQIFEASHFFMEEKIEEIANSPKDGGQEDFSNPDDGKSLAWTRKGSGMENTQYLGHRLIERDDIIPDRILEQTFSLDDIVNMHPTYKEIEKEFRGTIKKLKLPTDYDESENKNDDDFVPDIDDNDTNSKERKKPSTRKKRKKKRRLKR